MTFSRCTRALAIAAIGTAMGCGGRGPAAPEAPGTTITNRAALAIVGLTATVQTLTTTPQPGLAYQLTYQLHESAGRIGATAVAQHFAFSNGTSADGNFNSALAPPHIAPGGTITVQSSYSIFPATTPASHVTFTVTFVDDMGQSATASAEADVSRIGP
jgi:hypothetical protein